MNVLRRAQMAALVIAVVLAAAAAHADAPSFIARAERTRVAVGESFVFEVTLSMEDGRADGYRAPDFKGLRVLGEFPSQSTQIQMGGGGSFMQTVYSWRYELAAQQKGVLTIGPARVRVAGRELRTQGVNITVGDSAGPGAAAPGGGPGARMPFGGGGPAPEGDTQAFVRVVPSANRVYVGQQVTVEWLLYLTERPDKYVPISEPRTDGFWVEDLAQGQRSLTLSREEHEGRGYLVGSLMKKALFPLQPGKLTISPMEAEISQVDFFGSTMRTQRLKAEPLVIEAQPLPTAGRPSDFDPSAVGRFAISAKIDNDKVSVGEAVTLTVTVTGQGNLRRLALPKIGPLEGWKVYDPKVAVTLDQGDVVAGRRTLEYLLLPERAGVTTIPAITLPFFDTDAKSYVTEKTAPLRVEVSGDRASDATAGAGKIGAKGTSTIGGGVENVLPMEIRPLRSRASFRRDLGTTFYRSRAFVAVLAAPPVALVLTVFAGFVRERLSQETDRARRRRLRRLVRRRLRIAEKHLDAKNISSFFIEIDRVLRDFLAGKLGSNVAGLAHDELRATMVRAGLAEELVAKVIDELEECDRARFAPGDVSEEDMRSLLDRAAETIFQIEKAALKPGVTS